jgi:hypothetical protein
MLNVEALLELCKEYEGVPGLNLAAKEIEEIVQDMCYSLDCRHNIKGFGQQEDGIGEYHYNFIETKHDGTFPTTPQYFVDDVLSHLYSKWRREQKIGIREVDEELNRAVWAILRKFKKRMAQESQPAV